MSDTAIDHVLLAKRRAFADAYYARLKDTPNYTRKRVTLAMLRDILEHMVFPVAGLSIDQSMQSEAAFAAEERMMQMVREHAAIRHGSQEDE